jgi:site-specific recombinase XerD
MVARHNYKLVREFLEYVEESNIDAASVERYRFQLRHFLLWADETSVGEIAHLRPNFPRYLAGQPGKNGRGWLAIDSQKKIIEVFRRFLYWVKMVYPDECRHLSLAWIKALRIARNGTVQEVEEHIFVSVEEAIQLATLPTPPEDIALLRDRALCALLLASGMRLTAALTIPITAIDVAGRSIKQWPSLGVKTKNGKAANTFLLPIPELLQVIEEWDQFVRAHLPPTALWYAPITHCWGEQSLALGTEPGKNRNQSFSKRLKRLYKLAGLPYKSAHKWRHGHAVYGLLHARNMADYKAVSMNLMHANVKVTDGIYAPMLDDGVRNRIAGLAQNAPLQPDDKLSAFISRLSHEELSRALVIIAARIAQ